MTARTPVAIIRLDVAHQRHRKAAHLARWLGPWADAEATPEGVTRTTESLELAGGGSIRCYRYEPARGGVSGTYVVAHGLHFAGPDDPRLDRFCRILASAGMLVIAPFIRAYTELRMAPSAAEDVGAAVDHAVKLSAQLGLPRPALFSISFGSTPVIEVAASERHRDAVGALVLFGGFFDFFATLRFTLTARAFDDLASVVLPHDPVNAPAVFLNLAPHLEVPGDPETLVEAWRAMVHRSWSRPELRTAARRWPIAEAIAADLPEAQRELFFIGCDLLPGGAAHLEAGLARAGDAFDFTRPADKLARLAAPAVICHGRDDDVIPFTEAQKLREALAGDHPHRLHLTGLYGHTGTTLVDPSALTAEVSAMLEMLYSVVDAPHEAL
ncbi:MAG: hypothetical protein R3B72_15820 [Polyangiaceae bacterium]